MRVAATHAVLGSDGSLGVADRREHWRSAREIYGRSLDIWRDMQTRRILTAEDAAKPEEVAREIARCEAEMRRLAG
jgi:hypothetical protein